MARKSPFPSSPANGSPPRDPSLFGLPPPFKLLGELLNEDPVPELELERAGKNEVSFPKKFLSKTSEDPRGRICRLTTADAKFVTDVDG